MKTLKKLSKRSVFATFTLALMVALVLSSFTPVYADETDTPNPAVTEEVLTGDQATGDSGGGGNYSITELEEKATDTLKQLKTTAFNICLAIFPVSLIVCLAVLFFTHDERKIATTTKICVTICIVTGLIMLVNADVAIDIIETFTNGLQK